MGYDYGYVPSEGSYPNHYNPYMHYGDPQSQHQMESPHSYENLGQHLNYQTPSANPENIHYPPPPQHLNPYTHHVIDSIPMQHREMHPSHYTMMPGPNHGTSFFEEDPTQMLTIDCCFLAGMYKEENMEDPYSFVDEDPSLHRTAPGMAVPAIKMEPSGLAIIPLAAPKKRGRKKKIQTEIEWVKTRGI